MNTKLRTARLGIAVLMVISIFSGLDLASSGESARSKLENNETPYEYNDENFTILAKGKNLSDENIVQQRKALIDLFLAHSGDKISPRYMGASEDLKTSEDSRLVAYGFKLLPDGVIKEYRGYCNKDLKGYEKAISKADKWFGATDTGPAASNKETVNGEVLSLGRDWRCINTCTEHYTYSPYGDYSTGTEWFWDNEEINNDTDYFMLISSFSMMPGRQQYNNYWLNYYGYINHDWKYCDYSGRREMDDAMPYDKRGETRIGVTLSVKKGFSIWPTILPDYSMNERSDYIQDVAKWEVKINPLSENCGGSTFSVKTCSAITCSRDEARSAERLGLAYFEAKPIWIQISPFNAYNPEFRGYSNCVRWTGSAYDENTKNRI